MTGKYDIYKRIFAALFVVVGCYLIFNFILTIGRDKGLTESKVHVTVLFKNIGGLMEGAPARLSGVHVGNVESIDFLSKEVDGRRVKVTLSIFEKHEEQLRKSKKFFIKTEGILGEKLIEIYADLNGPPVDLSKPVIGEEPLDVQDLAPVFIRAAETFTKTSEELSRIDMAELAGVMQESSQALLDTSKGINAIISELEDMSIKAKRILDRFEEKIIEGDLFKVF